MIPITQLLGTWPVGLARMLDRIDLVLVDLFYAKKTEAIQLPFLLLRLEQLRCVQRQLLCIELAF